ncbi:beta-lactamase/transpeptidase-like protein [Hyaloraphidium curvatum]|nr:beta-lactamase/transpeptidase-like protein [Hyaloraphidium curvatum]
MRPNVLFVLYASLLAGFAAAPASAEVPGLVPRDPVDRPIAAGSQPGEHRAQAARALEPRQRRTTTRRPAVPTLAAVDRVVNPQVGTAAPGIAVLVTRRGVPIHVKGYGFADLASRRRITPDTAFDLASVSKQFTGLAAKLLQSRRRLSLDTRLAALIPVLARSPADGARPVRVGDVLRHLSGFADYEDDPDFAPSTTNAQVMAWLARQPLARRPGTAFEYSNTGYLALASAVGAAAGMPFASYLRTRVFDPLGMRATDVFRPARGTPLALGYAGRSPPFTRAAEPTAVLGDGNVFSTINDLAKYERSFFTGALLNASARADLFSNGRLDSGRPVVDDEDGSGYGFGWSLWEQGGSRYVGHSGAWTGYSTMYLRNLRTGVSVVVLSNGEELEVQTLAEQIEAVV